MNPLEAALSAEGISGTLADLARAIYAQESGSGRSTRTSNRGAVGGMQVIPATFQRMADPGWSIDDPVQNARAGVRYIRHLQSVAGEDPQLIAAGYYGGEGAIPKARAGLAVRDPVNQGAPDTLQYGQQVAARIPMQIDPGLVKWDDVDASRVKWDASPGGGATGGFGAGATGGWGGETPLDIAKRRGGGVVRGLRDPVDAGAQMLVRGVEAATPDSWTTLDDWAKREVARVDSINRGAEQDYQRNWRGGGGGYDGGRLLGNIIGSAPIAAALPVGAGTGLAARTALSAIGGGVSSAFQPVEDTENFWTEKGKQVGTGAAFGAAAAPIAAGVSRIISPKSSPQVQALLDEGITPTPGQVLGGAFKTSEEKLTSVPLLGDAIKSGQRRAVRQFDAAAVNRALDPIGAKLPKGSTGRGAIDYADDALGAAYNRVLGKVGAPAVDDKMLSELASLRSLVANQPKDFVGRLDRIIDNEILARTQDGRLTGEAVKAAERNLGNLARGLRRNADYDTSKLGDAVLETQRILRSWLERSAPKGVGDELRAVNSAWARFMRVQRAAASTGAAEGVFTPAQLQSAVKALDPGRNKGSFARGAALMQDLSEPAKAVLSQPVPDSGTAGRMLGSLLAGGAMTGATYLNPALGAAMLPAAAYAPGAQKVVAQLLAGRQGPAFKAGAEGVRVFSPALATLLAPQLSGSP